MRKCNHKRTRKNYPHGRKSTPLISCKDCGQVISRSELKKEKQTQNQRNGRRK